MAAGQRLDVDAVRPGRLRWRLHALERLAERGLSTAAVKQAILSGELIEEYPATAPYPSSLVHAEVADRPLHVVVGWDEHGTGMAYVITAYAPDETHFEPDLKTRKRRPHE